MDNELQSALNDLKGLHTSFAEKVNGEVTVLKNQLNDIQAYKQKPGAPSESREDLTPGGRFTKSIDPEFLRKSGRMRVELGHMWPDLEGKTLVDSAALGFSTPGILSPQRIDDSIVGLPRRRLTVRDLLRAKPITAGQVDWIQELAFTNAASPQVEGNSKQESANSWVIASEKVRTLAHWLPITRQAADDLPELRRFIDDNLVWGLKVIEEWELLFGDGSGEHLHGLAHQAMAYAGTYDTASDSKLDVLRHGILELEVADEQATAFIINPVESHSIDLIKTNDGGANLGSYIVGDPLGGTLRVRTLWGRPVIVTNVMPAGKFLVGDFSKAVIGDRMGATVEASESHDDFWVKNKLALRCEERISLANLTGGRSFRYGDI